MLTYRIWIYISTQTLMSYWTLIMIQYCLLPSSSFGPVANATDVLQPLRLIVLSFPPLFLDVPTSTSRCLHARNDARDPSSERWNCVDEKVPVILPKWQLPRHLGIFYMPQIYNMGPTALFPLRRKACWGFFCPEKSWRLRPGLNPRTRAALYP